MKREQAGMCEISTFAYLGYMQNDTQKYRYCQVLSMSWTRKLKKCWLISTSVKCNGGPLLWPEKMTRESQKYCMSWIVNEDQKTELSISFYCFYQSMTTLWWPLMVLLYESSVANYKVLDYFVIGYLLMI